jgi:restriction endonuclease S subunit
MKENWKEVKLGGCVDLITGHPFKSKDFTDKPSDIRLLRGDNIAQKYLRWDKAKFWPEHESDKYKKFFLQEGDLVLAMDRPWIEAGLKVARIQEKDLPSLLVQRVSRLRGTDKLNTGFLYYVLTNPLFTSYVLGVQTGTGIPHISPTQIKDYYFKIPPLDVQERIAEILGAIDDKIELNKRMNLTLEEMAMALYKYWFLQFGPFQRIASLEEFFPIMTGKRDANFAAENGEYPFFTCSKSISRADSYSFDGDAILLAGNGDFYARWYRGKFEAYQRTYVLIPYKKEFLSFLYLTIKFNLDHITSGATGSVIKFITKGMIGNYKIAVNTIMLEKFSEVVNPLLNSIEQNEKENETLIQLRDFLLPRLLSGDIELEEFSETS